MKAIAKAILLAFCCGPIAAEAGIVFELGNNPQPGEENILLNSGASGNTVSGTSNQTNHVVDFTSTQTLLEPTAGQARITGDGTPLTNLSISLHNGGTFTDFILNTFIDSTSCPNCGGLLHAEVHAWFNGAPESLATFDYSLGNGQNFLTIFAISGETIQEINLTASAGFSSFVSPRISGPYSDGVVPEPATLALFGIGLAGLSFSRRKQ